VLNQVRRRDGKFDLKNFKVVYVAPMKALVTEIVGNFQKRLSTAFGVTVRELTGDVHLSKSEIDET
jgi:pre-mRNA-splicing helicase BRR2